MDEEPKPAEEMRSIREEPPLPMERKRIGWSLALGIGLLGLLLWSSNAFFPATPCVLGHSKFRPGVVY